jgi:hypothetical protein
LISVFTRDDDGADAAADDDDSFILPFNVGAN